MEVTSIVQILQSAISPVVLISGIGLLVLSLTNRFGRVVDRTRDLVRERRAAGPEEQRHIRRQLRVLARRGRLLRTSIVFAVISILLVAVIVLALFGEFAFGLHIEGLIFFLFAASILSLIASMAVFLQDISISLHALDMEITDR